jgi:hypothetical protein
MLLFLNIDCVLDVPSDDAGPRGDGASGIRRLEAVLETWPQWCVVVTSERRYRMTLAHFRGFFDAPLRPRVIGTTPLYDRRRPLPRRTREDEIEDFLAQEARSGAPWVAVDNRSSQYPGAAGRLVCCESFTAHAAARLHSALMRQAVAREEALRASWSPAPAVTPRPALHA